MGKILLYSAGRACQSLSSNILVPSGVATASVQGFLDTSGNTKTELYISAGSNYASATITNLRFMNGLTSYVSNDKDTDFDISHYTTRELSDITYNSRASTSSVSGCIYTVSVTNTSSESQEINSIKFTKRLYSSSTSSSITCLILGYFFDSAVTLASGETKTFAVNLDFRNY